MPLRNRPHSTTFFKPIGESPILARLGSEPFFLPPAYLPRVLASCETSIIDPQSHGRAYDVAAYGLHAERDDETGQLRYYRRQNGVALITGSGALVKGESWFGVLDYDEITLAVAQAADDPAVHTTVLNIESPGGSCIGAGETAARIADIRQQSGKEIVTLIDVMGCSAMYYLAAGTSIVATPSAAVGSIGTIMIKEVIAGLLAEMGIEVEVYKSGELKDMTSGHRASTDTEAAHLQGVADTFGAQFRDFVTHHRPGIAPASMQGQVIYGHDALGAGLVDGLVLDRADLLARIAAARNASGD